MYIFHRNIGAGAEIEKYVIKRICFFHVLDLFSVIKDIAVVPKEEEQGIIAVEEYVM